MTGSTQQIVTAYEVNGLEPEQIVIAFDGEYDILAIKSVLMQFSGKYRSVTKPELQADGTKKEVGFTDEDETFALSTIRRLAEYAEDEHIQAKMAMYIREDKRGRRDAVKQVGQGASGNIFLLQQFISKGNEALKFTEKKAIDITSTSSKAA